MTQKKKEFAREIRWLRDEKYGGKMTREVEKDVARLERGEHVDYVMGWVDFAGCRIDLSKRPLIPRPETEHWVLQAIDELRRQGSPPLKILDIFAGSGCIGVAVLKYIPQAQVDFAEKDQTLLKQIRINAKLNGIDSKRYRVFQSDVFSNIKRETRPEPVEGYDYIFANPPYVAEARKAKVQKSVLEQEPKGAIFGGKDGLYYIRKFLKNVRDYLVPGGVVYLEFDSHQRSMLAKIIRQAGASDSEFFRDQFGKWRYAGIVF